MRQTQQAVLLVTLLIIKEQIANTATRSNVLAIWKHDMDFDSDRHLDYIGGKCRHFYRQMPGDGERHPVLKSITSQCTYTHVRLYILVYQYLCRYCICQFSYFICSCFCFKWVAQFSATRFLSSSMPFEKHFVFFFFFKTTFRRSYQYHR